MPVKPYHTISIAFNEKIKIELEKQNKQKTRNMKTKFRNWIKSHGRIVTSNTYIILSVHQCLHHSNRMHTSCLSKPLWGYACCCSGGGKHGNIRLFRPWCIVLSYIIRNKWCASAFVLANHAHEKPMNAYRLIEIDRYKNDCRLSVQYNSGLYLLHDWLTTWLISYDMLSRHPSMQHTKICLLLLLLLLFVVRF